MSRRLCLKFLSVLALTTALSVHTAHAEKIISDQRELYETQYSSWYIKHKPGYDYRVRITHISGTPVQFFTLSKKQFAQAQEQGLSCLPIGACEFLGDLSEAYISDVYDSGWNTPGLPMRRGDPTPPKKLRRGLLVHTMQTGEVRKFTLYELDEQLIYFVAIAQNIEDGRWSSVKFATTIERERPLFGKKYRREETSR